MQKALSRTSLLIDRMKAIYYVHSCTVGYTMHTLSIVPMVRGLHHISLFNLVTLNVWLPMLPYKKMWNHRGENGQETNSPLPLSTTVHRLAHFVFVMDLWLMGAPM